MRKVYWFQLVVSYSQPTNGEYKLGFEAASHSEAVLKGYLHMVDWLATCSSNVITDGFQVCEM